MAGVYIEGIKMPVGEELLCLNIFPDGKVTNHFNLRCDGIARAFPVPPHGRLIDADALPLEENVPTVMMHNGERWISAYELAMAPIIIPAEEANDE